ncbi:hypothetical protein PCE1_003080 [Barthelona sp. PCE]
MNIEFTPLSVFPGIEFDFDLLYEELGDVFPEYYEEIEHITEFKDFITTDGPLVLSEADQLAVAALQQFLELNWVSPYYEPEYIMLNADPDILGAEFHSPWPSTRSLGSLILALGLTNESRDDITQMSLITRFRALMCLQRILPSESKQVFDELERVVALIELNSLSQIPRAALMFEQFWFHVWYHNIDYAEEKFFALCDLLNVKITKQVITGQFSSKGAQEQNRVHIKLSAPKFLYDIDIEEESLLMPYEKSEFDPRLLEEFAKMDEFEPLGVFLSALMCAYSTMLEKSRTKSQIRDNERLSALLRIIACPKSHWSNLKAQLAAAAIDSDRPLIAERYCCQFEVAEKWYQKTQNISHKDKWNGLLITGTSSFSEFVMALANENFRLGAYGYSLKFYKDLDNIQKMAECQILIQDEDSARDTLLECIDKFKGRKQAEAYHSMGKISDDEDFYRSAIEVWPRYAPSHFKLGEGAMRRKDNEVGLQHMQAGAEIAPFHAGVFFSIGYLHMQAQRFTEGTSAFRRSVELDPTVADAWANLAMCFMYDNKLAEAHVAIRQATHHCVRNQQIWKQFAVISCELRTVTDCVRALIQLISEHSFIFIAVLEKLIHIFECNLPTTTVDGYEALKNNLPLVFKSVEKHTTPDHRFHACVSRYEAAIGAEHRALFSQLKRLGSLMGSDWSNVVELCDKVIETVERIEELVTSEDIEISNDFASMIRVSVQPIAQKATTNIMNDDITKKLNDAVASITHHIQQNYQ